MRNDRKACDNVKDTCPKCETRKADSWRCGVVLYVLITGRLPYHATLLGNYIMQVLTLPPVVPIEDIDWVSAELKDPLYKLLATTKLLEISVIADAQDW